MTKTFQTIPDIKIMCKTKKCHYRLAFYKGLCLKCYANKYVGEKHVYKHQRDGE